MRKCFSLVNCSLDEDIPRYYKRLYRFWKIVLPSVIFASLVHIICLRFVYLHSLPFEFVCQLLSYHLIAFGDLFI